MNPLFWPARLVALWAAFLYDGREVVILGPEGRPPRYGTVTTVVTCKWCWRITLGVSLRGQADPYEVTAVEVRNCVFHGRTKTIICLEG